VFGSATQFMPLIVCKGLSPARPVIYRVGCKTLLTLAYVNLNELLNMHAAT